MIDRYKTLLTSVFCESKQVTSLQYSSAISKIVLYSKFDSGISPINHFFLSQFTWLYESVSGRITTPVCKADYLLVFTAECHFVRLICRDALSPVFVRTDVVDWFAWHEGGFWPVQGWPFFLLSFKQWIKKQRICFACGQILSLRNC